MSSTRGFPFAFSPEARSFLGPASVLNSAVMEAFPELTDCWASRRARFVTDSLQGPGVVVRDGRTIAEGEVVGVFGGTVFQGTARRGLATLPLPSFRVHGVEMAFHVDGAARASRAPSAGEAAIYQHSCGDDEWERPNIVSEWWMEGPVPCLVARAAYPLRQLDRFFWDFNLHGAEPYTMSRSEAKAWRRAGHRAEACRCSQPEPCVKDRFVRLADLSGSSDDSDW